MNTKQELSTASIYIRGRIRALRVISASWAAALTFHTSSLVGKVASSSAAAPGRVI